MVNIYNTGKIVFWAVQFYRRIICSGRWSPSSYTVPLALRSQIFLVRSLVGKTFFWAWAPFTVLLVISWCHDVMVHTVVPRCDVRAELLLQKHSFYGMVRVPQCAFAQTTPFMEWYASPQCPVSRNCPYLERELLPPLQSKHVEVIRRGENCLSQRQRVLIDAFHNGSGEHLFFRLWMSTFHYHGILL